MGSTTKNTLATRDVIVDFQSRPQSFLTGRPLTLSQNYIMSIDKLYSNVILCKEFQWTIKQYLCNFTVCVTILPDSDIKKYQWNQKVVVLRMQCWPNIDEIWNVFNCPIRSNNLFNVLGADSIITTKNYQTEIFLCGVRYTGVIFLCTDRASDVTK